jgi:hypothetical protein
VSSSHATQRLSEQSDFALASSHLTTKGTVHEHTSGSAVQTEKASSIGSNSTSKLADAATAPNVIASPNLAALTHSPGRMLRKLDYLAESDPQKSSVSFNLARRD